jgi:Glycosyl transferase family 2
VTAAAEGAATLEQEILARPVEEREAVRAFFAEYPAGEGAPIAVVIPAYNEEPTVASVVHGIPREISGRAVEVIVVVDGSDDRTAEEARAAGALVCDVPINRGQGLIFMLGYWLATPTANTTRPSSTVCSSRSSPAAQTSSTARAGSAPN